jgi:hypothetical protein
MTDRKKPGVAFWASVVLSLALLYPISLGPACWLTSHVNTGASALSIVYRPMVWAMLNSETLDQAIEWYSELVAADGWAWAGTDETWRWRKIPPGGM